MIYLRYTLIRFISEDTRWTPRFALKAKYNGDLVTGMDNIPNKPFWFESAYEAINWVRQNCPKGSSVEWEGTTF